MNCCGYCPDLRYHLISSKTFVNRDRQFEVCNVLGPSVDSIYVGPYLKPLSLHCEVSGDSTIHIHSTFVPYNLRCQCTTCQRQRVGHTFVNELRAVGCLYSLAPTGVVSTFEVPQSLELPTCAATDLPISINATNPNWQNSQPFWTDNFLNGLDEQFLAVPPSHIFPPPRANTQMSNTVLDSNQMGQGSETSNDQTQTTGEISTTHSPNPTEKSMESLSPGTSDQITPEIDGSTTPIPTDNSTVESSPEDLHSMASQLSEASSDGGSPVSSVPSGNDLSALHPVLTQALEEQDDMVNNAQCLEMVFRAL